MSLDNQVVLSIYFFLSSPAHWELVCRLYLHVNFISKTRFTNARKIIAVPTNHG